MRPRVPRVLVVEDNADIARLVKFNLSDLPASITIEADGPRGLACAQAQPFDLLVLDLNLPGLSGAELLARLRASGGRTPALILTGQAPDRDSPLHQLGPIEWMRKPFGVADLIERVSSMLPSAQSVDEQHLGDLADHPDTLDFGPLQIDTRARRATLAGAGLELEAKIFELLTLLARHPEQVFSRREIRDRLWGAHSEVGEHTVNEMISKLRAQIEVDPRAPRWILPGPSGGYQFGGRRHV